MNDFRADQAHNGPRSSPAVAGGKVVTLGAGGVLSCPHFLSAWAGFGMTFLYAAVVLAAGGWLLARRDA